MPVLETGKGGGKAGAGLPSPGLTKTGAAGQESSIRAYFVVPIPIFSPWASWADQSMS